MNETLEKAIVVIEKVKKYYEDNRKLIEANELGILIEELMEVNDELSC